MALLSAVATEYQYSPLKTTGDQEIRLLTLLPGRFEDEICVQISMERQTDDLKYEALSYAWGLESTWASCHIQVSPDSQNSRRRFFLRISSTLEVALRHLRQEHSARTLWIDAICIDQANLQERGHQVKLMGDIYRRATRVVAWLGPAADDSACAFKFLECVGSLLELEWSNAKSPRPRVVRVSTESPDGQPHWIDQKAPIPFDKLLQEYHSLTCLISRSWFGRLWIRQEITMGSSESVVQCGAAALLWQRFRTACYYLRFWKHTYHLPERDPELNKLYNHLLDNIWSLCSLQGQPSGSLLESSRLTKCGDGRDRVYGLLNLLPSKLVQDMGITPDYDLGIAAVYTDFARRYIMAQNSLDILSSAGIPNSLTDLPSWVPDWTIRNDGLEWHKANTFTADGGLYAKYQFLDDQGARVLTATGTVLGEVYQLSTWGDAIHNPNIIEDWADNEFKYNVLFACRPTSQRVLDFYRSRHSALEAYCRVITTGSNCHKLSSELAASGSFDFEKAMTALQSILASFESSEGAKGRHGEANGLFIARVSLRNFVICITDEGRLGIVPMSARPGDLLCAFLGCSSVIALRPVPGTRRQYQVVGFAYLDGFAEGEAFLGPLPDGYNHVWRYDPEAPERSGVASLGFLESETGKLTWIDPRLHEFPIDTSGVGETKAAAKAIMGFVTVEHLKERGVQIEEFDLV